MKGGLTAPLEGQQVGDPCVSSEEEQTACVCGRCGPMPAPLKRPPLPVFSGLNCFTIPDTCHVFCCQRGRWWHSHNHDHTGLLSLKLEAAISVLTSSVIVIFFWTNTRRNFSIISGLCMRSSFLKDTASISHIISPWTEEKSTKSVLSLLHRQANRGPISCCLGQQRWK